MKIQFAHQRLILTEHWQNAKLKCSEISTFQNREIKMPQKYNVLQYILLIWVTNVINDGCSLKVGLRSYI